MDITTLKAIIESRLKEVKNASVAWTHQIYHNGGKEEAYKEILKLIENKD